jgi:hypothetical protein
MLKKHKNVIVKNYGIPPDTSCRDLELSSGIGHVLNSLEQKLLKFIILNACCKGTLVSLCFFNQLLVELFVSCIGCLQPVIFREHKGTVHLVLLWKIMPLYCAVIGCCKFYGSTTSVLPDAFLCCLVSLTSNLESCCMVSLLRR